MYRVEFILPVLQNDGLTSNLGEIARIEKWLGLEYNGFTSTQVRGGWIDKETNEYHEDVSYQVWTLVPTQEDVSALLLKARLWACRLDQISLLVTVTNTEVHFIEGIRAEERENIA